MTQSIGVITVIAQNMIMKVIWPFWDKTSEKVGNTREKDRKKIAERAEQLYSEKKISEAVYRRYMRIYEQYTIKLKDYKH